MYKYNVYTLEKGLVETDNYGEVISLTWHKENGPAYIKYDNNGNIIYESYYINGCRYTKEQYNKELLKLKVQSL